MGSLEGLLGGLVARADYGHPRATAPTTYGAGRRYEGQEWRVAPEVADVVACM